MCYSEICGPEFHKGGYSAQKARVIIWNKGINSVNDISKYESTSGIN